MLRRHNRSRIFPYTTLFRSGSSSLIKIGHKAGGNGLATQMLLVLTSVGIERRNHGDALSRSPLERVDHDELLHHRSEEHTSELQSLRHLVCRLLLEKKKPK